MKHRSATFLLILSLCLPLPGTAEGFDDMFGIMFRMMLTAMNVMSDMVDDNDWGGGSWPVSSLSSPWSAMSPGMGMWPGMGGMSGWPGSGFGMNPWSSMPWGAGNNAWSGMPWGGGSSPRGSGWPGGSKGTPFPVNTLPAVSLIEGKWYGSTGDILEIRGNRFRLKSGQYTVKGMLKIRDNHVWMYTPQTNGQTVYSFVRNQTELMLQESSGNVLLFQQNPLTGFKNMSYIF